MKKFYLIASIVCCTLSATAQKTLNLSTFNGTNIEKYAGTTCNVSVSRYVITGWNTISLPFAVSETVLNEVFGSNCKLERLVGIENDGTELKLNFQDCKARGIEPNIPYILYYSGETGTKKIYVENALVQAGESALTFNAEGTGETVTMAAAQKKTEAVGLYGVLAVDNADAKFVNTDAISTGFLATRCYVQLSSGNAKALSTNHIGGEVASIAQIAREHKLVDVYNLSGVRVATQIPVAEIQNLQKGIYVIGDKKVLVK